MKKLLTRALFCFCFLASASAYAVLEIEITQGSDSALPIAIVPFSWEGPAPQAPLDFHKVIANDLYHSGRFSPVPERDFLSRPYSGSSINYKDWRILGVESLVIGRVRAENTAYRVEFQVYDVFRQRQLTGGTIKIPYVKLKKKMKNIVLRRAAHQISDMVFEKLIGIKGAFTTLIAYVTHIRGSGLKKPYSLQVADSDGENRRPVLNSSQVIMSPSWSPDGRYLAYVSFEADNRPKIFIHEPNTGKRRLIAEHSEARGNPGAPSWSPDSKKIAFVRVSKGAANIYVTNLKTEKTKPITQDYAVNTEPVWSPSEDAIVFTSDRGGQPQLYYYDFKSRGIKRITFEGSYNTDASFSPDGSSLAMVHRENGSYRIAVMNMETLDLQTITRGQNDESPSFAPNGSMITYATRAGRRGVLATVSVDGNVSVRLASPIGDAREPVWSPYRN